MDSGATSGIVQTKETAPLNRCEEHAEGPLAELKTSGRRICACPPQGILARIATNGEGGGGNEEKSPCFLQSIFI